MTTAAPTVFIVDDDMAVRKSLRMLLGSVGINAEAFGTAQEFLDAYDPERGGCVVLDIRMPRMSGLELQQRLAAARITIPIIVISGHGDVAVAVRAMKTGAVDFLEKPFSNEVLLERINEALQRDAVHRRRHGEDADILARLATLSPREREVVELIASGKSNKEAAAILGVSRKTIEVHRSHFMEKMKADSLAEVVQMMTRVKVHAQQPA